MDMALLETLNLQSPAGVTPKGEQRTFCGAPSVFSKYLLFERET